MPSIAQRPSSNPATPAPFSVQETSTGSTSNTPTPTPARLRMGQVLVTPDPQSEFAVSLAKKYEREAGVSTASTSTARPRRTTVRAPSRQAPYTTATIVSAALAAFGIGGLGVEGLWTPNAPSSDESDETTTMGMVEQNFDKATTISFSTTSKDYQQGSDWLDQAAETTPPPKPDDDGEASVEDEAEPTQEPEHGAEPVIEANEQQGQEVKNEAGSELKVQVGQVVRHKRSAQNDSWGIFKAPTVLYLRNKGAFTAWGRLTCNHVPSKTEDLLSFKYDPDHPTVKTSFWTNAVYAGGWTVINIPAGARECHFTAQANTHLFIENLYPDRLLTLDLNTGYKLVEFHVWGSVFWQGGEWQDPSLHPEHYDWANTMFRINPEGCIVATPDTSCRTSFRHPQQYTVRNVCLNPAAALLKSTGLMNEINCGMPKAPCDSSEGVIHNVYMAYGSSRGTLYGCKNMEPQNVTQPYLFNGWRYKF